MSPDASALAAAKAKSKGRGKGPQPTGGGKYATSKPSGQIKAKRR